MRARVVGLTRTLVAFWLLTRPYLHTILPLLKLARQQKRSVRAKLDAYSHGWLLGHTLPV